MDHTTIQRLLRLMLMLSSNVDYTTNELASNLEITERSAFRYIRTFKDSGFTIQKRGCNVHKLMKLPVRQIKLSELIHLSPEEAHILHTLLMSISGDSQVLINLEKKLTALFDATSVTEIIGNKTAAQLRKEYLDKGGDLKPLTKALGKKTDNCGTSVDIDGNVVGIASVAETKSYVGV